MDMQWHHALIPRSVFEGINEPKCKCTQLGFFRIQVHSCQVQI